MKLQDLINQVIEDTGLPSEDEDATITGYHATDVLVNEIGVDKKTMFFTTNLEDAKSWGEDNYEDYHIIGVNIPVKDFYEFKPKEGRKEFAVHDFEALENNPEEMEGPACYLEDCCDGFIVQDITQYFIQ